MIAALKNWYTELGVQSPTTAKNELLSGLTVALALVPEAVAFAFVAQVNPLVGLYAAFLVGLITAVFGGRPGMISGATGALAVVMVSLVAQHGVEYLFATVVLMGIIQIIAGIMRWGKFIRMIPYPVMLGFVNGLAIVIGMAQLTQFKTPEGTWLMGNGLMLMLGLTALTMAVIHFFPKMTKAIPAPLAGILITTALAIGLGLEVSTVGDLASIAGGLPDFHIPMVPLTGETLKIILPYAVILAAIGLIESLLTLNLVSEIKNEKGGASRECVAQGASNLITGFFGGMGGCAMIGQSMINVKSGGLNRLSGISAALFLLAFILFGSSLIEMIPLAALVGVMFMVVIGTFAWQSIAALRKMRKSDAFVVILVTAVTVWQDLAIAVIVGVIVSALVYSWNSSTHLDIRTSKTGEGNKIYTLYGPLFFGSTESFMEIFDPENDTDDVVIDFMHSRVWDSSAIEAIDKLADKYRKAGKELHLCHLSPDCVRLLTRAKNMVEVSTIEDPNYGVAADYDLNK
ncbi:SulP family inorganic anion transporter [Temperatibacter marinus]|uniref:SulP family inorganic anion transporter n=1 Tax=Temperatibacter marinus TaxID=1456591 RepID=A0AA52HA23_9PROT|nr:SulP family inorganic anion transporter [Temperatibacter marinus]WND03786.1 SulP family inorganic anion transporter [Temperatibacter marinus]